MGLVKSLSFPEVFLQGFAEKKNKYKCIANQVATGFILVLLQTLYTLKELPACLQK